MLLELILGETNLGYQNFLNFEKCYKYYIDVLNTFQGYTVEISGIYHLTNSLLQKILSQEIHAVCNMYCNDL